MKILMSKFSLVSAICAAFIFNACEKQAAPAMSMPPQPVSTMSVEFSDQVLNFSYPSRLSSERDAIIKPKVSGMIVEKLFKAGDEVKKDQPLFIIEQDKFKAAEASAKASLEVARANFLNAEQDHKRNQNLFEKNAISQKEFDTSLANFRSASANLKMSEANLKSAQLDLKYSVVSAPFDGFVGDGLVNIGDYVAAGSSELVRVVNLDEIQADFYMSDKDKLKLDANLKNQTWLAQNLAAKITQNGEEFSGRLVFVDLVIDEKSANVKAKAIFENKEHKLLPGTFAKIEINGFVQKDGVKIPQIALMQDQKQNTYVYTLGAENKVMKSPVDIAYQNNESAIISSGLKEGEKVILNNFKKIRVGSVVQEIGAE